MSLLGTGSEAADQLPGVSWSKVVGLVASAGRLKVSIAGRRALSSAHALAEGGQKMCLPRKGATSTTGGGGVTEVYESVPMILPICDLEGTSKSTKAQSV